MDVQVLPSLPAFTVFVFEGDDVRSIVDDNGDPLFVVRDVCAILGIVNPSSAISRLEPDERTLVLTEGGRPGLAAVTEPGLYALILGTRLRKGHDDPEQAARTERIRRFKRWVTHEVLPTIRKTGSYSIAPAPAVPQTLPAALRAYADQLEATAAAEAQVLALAETVAVLEPKAEQADHHRAADGLTSVGDFANSLKAWALREHGVRVVHAEVWGFLGELGLLIRGDTLRHNQPTSFAIERDFVRVKVGERQSKSSSSGTKATATSRLTPAGEGWVWDRAVKRIAEHGSLRKPEPTAIATVRA